MDRTAEVVVGGQRVQDTSHLLLALDEGVESRTPRDVIIT
jgi:hypothetical protein